MKGPSIAPAFCALYPSMTVVTRMHGYALAIHGTLGRDFDLVAVPWADEPSPPEAVVASILDAFALVVVGQPETKAHGRRVWTLSLGFGSGFLDLSFMPTCASRNRTAADPRPPPPPFRDPPLVEP